MPGCELHWNAGNLFFFSPVTQAEAVSEAAPRGMLCGPAAATPAAAKTPRRPQAVVVWA